MNITRIFVWSLFASIIIAFLVVNTLPQPPQPETITVTDTITIYIQPEDLQTELVIHGQQYVMCGANTENMIQICNLDKRVQYSLLNTGRRCMDPGRNSEVVRKVDKISFFDPYTCTIN